MTRLKSLILILILVTLYAFYYWGVPFVLNIENKTPLIENYIKKELGMPIEIKNPALKMGLTPSVWLDASYVGIVDKKSVPLEIVNPKIKVRLLPLIFGKFEVAYLSCDKITADFKKDKASRFFIGDYLILKNANPKISIENSQMEIQQYSIKLKDELENKNILLKGDYFDLKKYNSSQGIAFSTNSKLKINKNYSNIDLDVNLRLPLKKSLNCDDVVFDGTILNLNLADLSPYIKKFSKGEINQLNGILNVTADTKTLDFKTTQINSTLLLDNFLIAGKNLIKLDGRTKVNSSCNFSKRALKINQFDISSKDINANIKGNINNPSSKNPRLNLSIAIKKSRIEKIIPLFPNAKPEDIGIDLKAIKKYGFYSDVDGKITVKGPSNKADINGELLIKNAYIIKPLPGNTPKANAKISFNGQKCFIDVLVPINNTERLSIKGDMKLFGDRAANLDIKSTQNADLKTTEDLLLPAHEIFGFDLGPLPVMKLAGIGNINLKVKGPKMTPELFGVFNFRNTTGCFNGLNVLLKNGEGSLYFDKTNAHFITRKASLDNKPIKIEGKCSSTGDLNFNIVTTNQNLNFLLNVLESSPMLSSFQKGMPPMTNVEGKVNLALNLKGKTKSMEDFSIGKTITVSGTIKLLGNSIFFNTLKVPIKNVFGNIKFKNSDAEFDLYSVINKSKFYIKGQVKNNVLALKSRLDNLSFIYSNIPVKIYGGNLEIRNNRLTLYKVNAVMDSMPILIDGFVTDIFKNPNFNVYINSKPTQKFIEKYINKTAIYPLKIKGDIIYSSRIHGTRDSFNAKTEVNLQEDSNIYYMGSTLGDPNNPIRIFLDTNVSKNSIYVNNFQYDELISSQDNKEFISPQLNAKGQINFNNKNFSLKNFIVRTQNPTDAKIFNLLFKKPIIKQGLFTSNLVINGPLPSPKMLGSLNFTGIDMPILDTTIKDISLDFKNNNIDMKTKGDIFSNNIVLFASLQNSLKPPFVFDDVDIYLGNLDVNEIVKSLNKIQLETDLQGVVPDQKFSIGDLIIKKAKIKADSVFVKNIFAKDLTADFSLNEKLQFDLNNFKFIVAEGNVKGDFKYNFLNSKSSLSLHVEKVNANAMAEALFDLPNQIYGSLAGDTTLSCNGRTHKTCMDTLSGKGGFSVTDGKMPKLGSLEYLLKAANLVKGGLMGLTINGLIDLVTPLKTGNFDNINGSFSIDSGIANDIQIFSKGKDLSMFLTGTYNFSTVIADLDIFGRLSKRVSTVLGPVGNTSLNTLFNTIPGLNLDETNKAEFINKLNKIPGFELNDKKYRIFSVKIYGDINGDNYVQSFKWIE